MFATLFVAALQEASLVESRILEAERIALGRVERVLELDATTSGAKAGAVRIAVVHVERLLLGPEGESVLHVVDTLAASVPKLGERALFFVGRFDGQLDARRRTEIDGASSGLPTWQLLSDWSWLLASPEVLLPNWLAEERSRAGESLKVEPVLTSMEEALSRCLPLVRAHSQPFGGHRWELRLGPDRVILEGAESSGILSTERWDEFLRLVERTKFLELPEHVGRSLGPCPAVTVLELRTRNGRRSVRIEDGAPESPESLDAWMRAREVWNALPGDRRQL